MRWNKKTIEKLKQQLKQEAKEEGIQVLTKEDLEGVAGAGRTGNHKPPK